MTIVKAAEQVVYDFSTHILTWRMTSSNAFKFSSSSFQLTSSQGGWQKIPYIIEIKSVFQLTSSQGGWHKGQIKFIVCANFQLTSSQGGWHAPPLGNAHQLIFQLTSSQGGWRMERGNRNHPAIFSTHILTRRMTFSSSQYSHSHPFQLTSSQGGWPNHPPSMSAILSFQLTSSQGGWRNVGIITFMGGVFSTHILTRRMTR